MTRSSRAGTDPAGAPVALADPWARVGQVAGLVAGVCILGQTALFLLDATDLLAETPEYTETPAGRAEDLATYFVAYFEHQREILWNIVVRDTLGPVGFLALMVLGVAVLNVLGSRRPEAQLLVLFFVVGGLLTATADLAYLTQANYWRHSEWAEAPTEDMIAVGRSVGAVIEVTTYPQYAGFVVLALGMVSLGRLCRREVGLSSRLGVLAYAESVALVGIVIASVLQQDAAYNVLALVTGALLGPAVAIWLGQEVARRGSPAADD